MRITVPLIKERIYDMLTSETVGFSRIPEQARKMSVERGFCLNLLVIGRRGSGTRTLVNNLFLSPVLNHDRPNTLSTTCAQVTENGVKLNVRVSTCHEFDEKNILEYLKSLNFSYFESTEGISKENINENENMIDKRIHLCIFILPTDNLLIEELKVAKTISEYTNLLCVIGKADTYMDNELQIRKQDVKRILNDWNITIFKPSLEIDYNLKSLDVNNKHPGEKDALEITRENIRNKNQFNFDNPFAVVASESLFKINGQTRRGRLYKWGFVDVNDTAYSDFLLLRRVVIGSNMEEIKENYETNFYEKYRLSQLQRKNFILKFRAEKTYQLFSDWQKNKQLDRSKVQKEVIEEEKKSDALTIVKN